jgi:hypothetical protein
MFNPADSETFWLNITNLLLGLATFAALAGFVTVTIQEVVARVRQHAAVRITNDDHMFLHDSLGLTMADGGERLAVPPAADKKSGEKSSLS